MFDRILCRSNSVAARSKAWVYGLSLAEIAGSNPARDMDVCLLLSVGCCRVEGYATGRSLVQRILSSVVCVCDRGTS